jgi:hypothetical protein
VTVYVVEQRTTAVDDLVASSTSSTGFWDNPEDDEDALPPASGTP